MSNEELLVAISDMMDEKLEEKLDKKLEEKLDKKLEEKLDKKFDEKLAPIYDRLTRIELIQENDILPRLQNIEECYLSTYKRYQKEMDRLENLEEDVVVLKKVVSEHSEKLQQLA